MPSLRLLSERVSGLVCPQTCTYLSFCTHAFIGRYSHLRKKRWTVDTKRRTPTPAKKSASSFWCLPSFDNRRAGHCKFVTPTPLRQLRSYIEVQPTTEMMDIIILIMIEVLTILGVAMKESRMS